MRRDDIPELTVEMSNDGVRPVESTGDAAQNFAAGGRSLDEEGIGLRAEWTGLNPTSRSWTITHTLHCFFLGCLVPTLICGGANFGVAIGIFKEEDPPTMWDFPIPMAGNFFVVILVQTFANFVISGNIQLFDVLNGIVPPLDPAAIRWWPKPDTTFFWWMQPTELILSPRDEPDKLVLERLLDSIMRAGMWILVAEIIFWPLSTIITFAVYGNTGYNSYPIPQWICCVQGAVLALFFMPLWQVSAYVTLGQRLLDEEEAWKSQASVSVHMEERPRPKSQYTTYRMFERTSSTEDPSASLAHNAA